MKKFYTLTLFLIISIAFSGCFSKQIQLSDDLSNPKTEIVEIDTPSTIGINLPTENTNVDITSPNELNAKYANEKISFKPTKQGDYLLSVTLTDKGYENSTIKIPIKVKLHSLDFDLTNSKGEKLDLLKDELHVLKDNPSELQINTTKDSKIKVSSDNKNISATLSQDNILTVLSSKKSEGNITITVTKENYEPYEYKFPVKTLLPPLDVQLYSKSSLLSSPVLELDKPQSLIINTSQKNYTVKSSADNDNVEIYCKGNIINLTPKAIGKTNISINIFREDFLPFSKEFTVEVIPQKAPISIGQATANIDLNKAISIPFTYDGNATFTYPKDKIELTQENGSLSIKGKTLGSGIITVNVTKPNYRSNTKTINFTVTKPNIDLTLSNKSDVIEVGKLRHFTISTQPKDTDISVLKDSDIIDCYVDGNTVYYNGIKKGDCSITITARKDNYITQSKTFNVTVKESSFKATNISNDVIKDILKYTNNEREKEGLSPLSYVNDVSKGAKIRAKEANENWAHIRPDGTEFNTIFDDLNLSYLGMGENLASATYWRSGKDVVKSWMNSPGHRANILRPEFTGIGIGEYVSSDGEYYYCQLFVY